VLGFVNVFKPSGPTSAQIGAFVRRIYGRRGEPKLPVGHLGTLDPMASGVLPLALGKATRLLPLIEDTRKAYAFAFELGRKTATGDATGATIDEAVVPENALERLEAAAIRFVGRIEQIPPMYSALHHEGKRLYERARAGETVVRPARTIAVYGLQILGAEGRIVRGRLACSEGTYVRTLCEDLGAAIGTVATMTALVREAAGPFVLYESRTPEQIEAAPAEALVPPERVIAIPTIVLHGRDAADFRMGRLVPFAGGSASRHVFVRDGERRLVGVGEAVGALLAPRKVFV